MPGLRALAAAGAAAAAAASARHDYLHDDRLSGRTQALMWPAYVLGGALVATTAAESRSRGSRASITLGAVAAASGTALFVAGARPFTSFGQLAGREPGSLITGGAFRLSRNPQYVGNVLVSAGAAVAARSVAAAAFTAAAALVYRVYVPAEEAHLERTFGDEYRLYRTQVPRWIGLPRGR